MRAIRRWCHAHADGLGATLAALVMAAIVGLYSHGAHAAPKALHGEECMEFADMAITARAFALQQVPFERLEAGMESMYAVGADERRTRIMRAIIVTAAALPGHVAPADFAAELYGHCMRGQGDMDPLLGEAS